MRVSYMFDVDIATKKLKDCSVPFGLLGKYFTFYKCNKVHIM
jgi:hypothetical protein